MTIRRLSIHNRLNESPELIAQEFMVSTFSLESLVSLNESPELIAQEYPDWGFFEHGAVRASMKVLSLLLRNPKGLYQIAPNPSASMKVLSLLLRNQRKSEMAMAHYCSLNESPELIAQEW